ncbi:MAG: helix-turn-helix domain-containing protein [Caulobacteraceae bacterium]
MMQDLRDMIAMGLAPQDAQRLAARVTRGEDDLTAALAEAWRLGATMALNASRGLRVCRVCGCWEREACDDGCWWVEQDLCSSCDASSGQVGRALAHVEMPRPQATPSMATIATKVAEHHGLTLADLKGPSRTQRISRVRHEAFFLCWLDRRFNARSTRSLPAIGAFFGGRDHTTVLHGLRAYAWRYLQAVAAGEAERFPEGLQLTLELLAAAYRAGRRPRLLGQSQPLALSAPQPTDAHANRQA